MKRAWFALLATVFLPCVAYGSDGFLLNLELGSHAYNAAVGSNFVSGSGSVFLFGAEVSKTLATLPFGLGFFGRGFVGGSKSVSLPVLETGISAYFYPFAKPETIYSEDNDVVVKSTGWVFYGKVQGGLEAVDLNNQQDIRTGVGIGAPFVAVAAGFTYPLSFATRTGFEAGYASTAGATDSSSNPFSFTGLMFAAHLSFFFR